MGARRYMVQSMRAHYFISKPFMHKLHDLFLLAHFYFF